MEESEKMVALKKAYAEIILNTAKEAAARVMASERGAIRSQHDLNAAKNEAILLLLRLKKMIDTKETAAEINAISQRRRIEELEAQLQEVEDKIMDLRTELRNVSDVVERNKNEVLFFSRESTEEKSFDPKDEFVEDHPNNVEPIVPYSSDSEHETIAASSVIGPFSPKIQDHKWPDDNKQSRQAGVSPLQDSFGDSSLASIIMGSAEPEAYRNGCTQRIRAFERQHPDVVLAKGEVDDRCISETGWQISGAGENIGEESTLAFPRSSFSTTRKRLLQEEKKKSKLQIRHKRKHKFARSKSSLSMSNDYQLMSCHQSSCGANHNMANNNTEAGEAVPAKLSSIDAKQNIQKDSAATHKKQRSNSVHSMEDMVLKGKRKRKVYGSVASCCSNSVTDANIKGDKDCLDVSKGETGILSQCDDPLLLLSLGVDDSARRVIDTKTIGNEQELSNESRLVEQECDSTSANGIPAIGLDTKETDVLDNNSDLKHAAIAHGIEEPTKADDTRFLKYTFQRKPKKDSSSCPSGGTSPEKGNKRKLEMDREDDVQGSKRLNKVDEPSRDSRRLAQVARQLISLSGKRW
ncbi:hypothetical protein SAY87_005009 [Trapa incisa]|uniref:Uncharacterized protein n=1 Tax=Trapa incisa TaxID=236973 RepID=A0AAN7JQ19_9MYRT|nr:hypothetical protein SAY87_005009 [Trapa incisa]